MKKYIKIILCIVLVSCLVSCDLSAIWNNIKGTTETTTTNTTTTISIDPSEIKILEDLLGNVEYDFASYHYYTANLSYDFVLEDIDFEEFFETYIANKELLITDNQEFVNQKRSDIYSHSKFANKLCEQFIMVISLYSYDNFSMYENEKVFVPHTSLYIYSSGLIEIESRNGVYVTIDDKAVDWIEILKKYFYYFNVWEY